VYTGGADLLIVVSSYGVEVANRTTDAAKRLTVAAEEAPSVAPDRTTSPASRSSCFRRLLGADK
jgi:hypothetical protein